LVFGEWQTLVFPFIIFTVVDLLYANWGLRREQNKLKLMSVVPLQRIVYRQLLYYTVYKGLIRAIEGTGSGWNKFKKMGATRQFFLSAMGGVEAALGLESTASASAQVVSSMPSLPEVANALHAEATARQEVAALSVMQTDVPRTDYNL